MAFVKVRVPRTSQPQDGVGVDWAHPLSASLVDAFPGPSNAAFANLTKITRIGCTDSYLTKYPAKAITANGTSDYFQLPKAFGEFGDGAFSVSMLLNIAYTGIGKPIIGTNKSGVAGGWLVWIDFRGKLGINTTASFSSVLLGGAQVSDFENFVTVTRTKEGVYCIYVNGVLNATRTNTPYDVNTGNDVKVFSQLSSSNTAFNFSQGSIGYIAAHKRALSATEVKALYNNPWQIFEPEEQWIWVPDAAEVGGTTVSTTLSGSWSVRNTTSAALSAAWSVRNAASSTLAASWSVRSLVGSTFTGAWSVQAAGVASATFTGSWSVRNGVATTAPGSWSVRGTVSTTQAGSWSVRNAASTSLIGAWSVRGLVDGSLPGAWSVLAAGAASSTLAGAWSVRGLSSASLVGAWSVGDLIADPFTPEQMAYILAYIQENLVVPTPAEIAAAVIAAAQATTLPVNLTQIRGQTVGGAGTPANPWGPT